MNICKICNRQFVYKRISGGTKTKCNSCSVNRHRFKRKQNILEFLGNKCSYCGYDKCSSALHVHHLDPSIKEFNLSGSHCRKWSDIKKELAKCILLCANCHAELHSGIITVNEPVL